MSGVTAGDRTIAHHDIDGVLIKCLGNGLTSNGGCDFCGIRNWLDRTQDRLIGKVLTVVDASVVEPIQNKAMNVWDEMRALEEHIDCMLAGSSFYVDLKLKNVDASPRKAG